MPAVSDAHVYEIKLVGRILSQECINIFYYGGAAAANIGALATAFGAGPIASLASIVSNAWQAVAIEVTHVKGGIDFGAFPYGGVSGSVSGECLPPFVTWDFTYVRGGVGDRNGYKRFSGVAEASQNGGYPTSGALAALNTLQNALSIAVSDGTTDYNPVIRRGHIARVKLTTPAFFDVSTVLYSHIGSQNSRKVGHGR